MTDKIPAVLGCPSFRRGVSYVPGSSFDYFCRACGVQLVVVPSSVRHMSRLRESHVFWLFCPPCTEELSRLWSGASTGEVHVMQIPGADEEMRSAGLEKDADETAAEAERLRQIFRRS